MDFLIWANLSLCVKKMKRILHRKYRNTLAKPRASPEDGTNIFFRNVGKKLPPPLPNNPEERSSHLLRVGSLKTSRSLSVIMSGLSMALLGSWRSVLWWREFRSGLSQTKNKDIEYITRSAKQPKQQSLNSQTERLPVEKRKDDYDDDDDNDSGHDDDGSHDGGGGDSGGGVGGGGCSGVDYGYRVVKETKMCSHWLQWLRVGRYWDFFGAFAKLRKATIRFVVSVIE